MTAQTTFPLLETEAGRRRLEGLGDLEDLEDHPTPRLLVRAILDRAMVRFWRTRPREWDDRTLRVLGIGSGYGVWESEIRRLSARQEWPVHITGVEINEARRPHLEKWCDEVCIRDWRVALRDAGRTVHGIEPVFDLAIGNPPFSEVVHEQVGLSMPAVLLNHAPAVLLYHPVNTFQRSKEGRMVYRCVPPTAKWLVPGTVSHDGTSAVASDCYQATLWIRGHDGPCIEHMLDVEAADVNREAGLLKKGGEPYRCWRWIVPPGSEEPSEDLPPAPGWV